MSRHEPLTEKNSVTFMLMRLAETYLCCREKTEDKRRDAYVPVI